LQAKGWKSIRTEKEVVGGRDRVAVCARQGRGPERGYGSLHRRKGPSKGGGEAMGGMLRDSN